MTIISNFHHGLFNRKAIRGFYYQPATGRWTEVEPKSLYSFWENDTLVFTDDMDAHIHIASCNGHLTHIAVLILGNENRKDVNRMGRNLEHIRADAYQNVKRHHSRIAAIMAS